MHKERADGTAWGKRLGLPRSQRGNLQRYGMQSPPQPLKQHRSHCSQSPAHHGRQRCNQLLKHLNAHAKGSLQNQVLLLLTKRQVAGLSEGPTV